jgi:hypothetical protein
VPRVRIAKCKDMQPNPLVVNAGRLKRTCQDGFKYRRAMDTTTMKTAFVICELLRPAIVSAYSEERAAQIERACNGALNDKETVRAAPGKTKWNQQINGGQSISAKGKFSAKEATWKETEEYVYSVEQATAPIEFVKFNGALLALYRKSGSAPSGELSIAVVPKYVRDWFNDMHAKALGKVKHHDLTGKNKSKAVKPAEKAETPALETNGQPA